MIFALHALKKMKNVLVTVAVFMCREVGEIAAH